MSRPGRVVTALALAVLATAYAGCADDQDRYCETVREHQGELTEIAASDDPDRLLDVLPVYRDLQGAAPDDVRDEWAEVVGAYERLERALDEAGVEPGDFDPDDPPADLSEEQRSAVIDAAARLTDPVTVEALGGLQQQARDVCRTPLAR